MLPSEYVSRAVDIPEAEWFERVGPARLQGHELSPQLVQLELVRSILLGRRVLQSTLEAMDPTLASSWHGAALLVQMPHPRQAVGGLLLVSGSPSKRTVPVGADYKAHALTNLKDTYEHLGPLTGPEPRRYLTGKLLAML